MQNTAGAVEGNGILDCKTLSKVSAMNVETTIRNFRTSMAHTCTPTISDSYCTSEGERVASTGVKWKLRGFKIEVGRIVDMDTIGSRHDLSEIDREMFYIQ